MNAFADNRVNKITDFRLFLHINTTAIEKAWKCRLKTESKKMDLAILVLYLRFKEIETYTIV